VTKSVPDTPLVGVPQWTRRLLLRCQENFRFQRAFAGCARMCQLSMVAGKHSPSLGISYLVGAIEAICQGGGDRGSFSDFVRERLWEPTALDEILDWVYGSVRSAHFHAGQNSRCNRRSTCSIYRRQELGRLMPTVFSGRLSRAG